MEKKKLTYKDFEIGQSVRCTNLGDNKDFYEQHLTIGKLYKILDLDFHFHESICVRSDNDKVSMFLNIELFAIDINIMRKLKLDRIVK